MTKPLVLFPLDQGQPMPAGPRPKACIAYMHNTYMVCPDMGRDAAAASESLVESPTAWSDLALHIHT